jgi:hypothetical protein
MARAGRGAELSQETISIIDSTVINGGNVVTGNIGEREKPRHRGGGADSARANAPASTDGVQSQYEA